MDALVKPYLLQGPGAGGARWWLICIHEPPAKGAGGNREGKHFLSVSLHCLLVTKFNIMPLGKENIFKGSRSIYKEQAMSKFGSIVVSWITGTYISSFFLLVGICTVSCILL